MPQCPVCHAHAKRRKKNSNGWLACPQCKVPVFIWDGHWFDDRPTAITTKIVAQFLSLYKTKYRSELELDGKGYNKSRAMAKKYLKKCHYDQRLALATMQLQFTGKGFSWKDRHGFGHLFHDLPTALPRVRASLRAKRDAQLKSTRFVDEIMSRENVFSPA